MRLLALPSPSCASATQPVDLETGEDTVAGWITREADEEAMLLVVAALGLQARIGVG